MPADKKNTWIIIMSWKKKKCKIPASFSFAHGTFFLHRKKKKSPKFWCAIGTKHSRTLLRKTSALCLPNWSQTFFSSFWIYTQVHKWDGSVVSAVRSSKPPHWPGTIWHASSSSSPQAGWRLTTCCSAATDADSEAAGCLVPLWQRDNSEILPAWKRRYSEEAGETGNPQRTQEINWSERTCEEVETSCWTARVFMLRCFCTALRIGL